jgi:hypothetical protein
MRHTSPFGGVWGGYLRGGDLDTFLLAGICNVGNGSALYVALPAQIVELGSAVHRTAIVPHDEVGAASRAASRSRKYKTEAFEMFETMLRRLNSPGMSDVFLFGHAPRDRTRWLAWEDSNLRMPD